MINHNHGKFQAGSSILLLHACISYWSSYYIIIVSQVLILLMRSYLVKDFGFRQLKISEAKIA